MEEYCVNEEVTPGIHPYAQRKVEEFFSVKQQQIVKIFKNSWYVTKADQVSIGASQYNYLLIKAPRNLAELFNITAEIIVIFSDYETFEPRTFDSFDYVKNCLEDGRVENICGVLVSRDKEIENKIKSYSRGNETRILIPYSYEELYENRMDNYLFRKKFQRILYARDLFAFDDALKTDLYFLVGRR